jgi:DNA-binding beta-propeller fold protein YncE
MGELPGVAVDSQDRLYVLNRGKVPILVFSPEGKLIARLGKGIIVDPHGIFIDRNDDIWCVDRRANRVFCLKPNGKVKLEIHGDCEPGKPFRWPTAVAVSSKGQVFVSDGYENARVHCFSKKGKWIRSWGRPGRKPGEFRLPHGIAVDEKNRVYVCDRENARVQIFDSRGKLLKVWRGLKSPSFADRRGHLYVSEMRQRVSVFSSSGKLVRRLKLGTAPHGLCVDSRGDLYVSEVKVRGSVHHITAGD